MTASPGTTKADPPPAALNVGLGHVLTEVKDQPVLPRPPIVQFRGVS